MEEKDVQIASLESDLERANKRVEDLEVLLMDIKSMVRDVL